nr:uncharacterized protein LOC118680911 [Bactrocera oleae]
MRYFVLVALVSLSPAKVHLVIRFSKLLRNSTHPMTIYEKCHIERVNKITTITIRQKLLQPIYSIQVSPEVRFKKIICNSTDPLTAYEKCHISNLNNSITAVTLHLKLRQPIYSAYVNITIIQLSNNLNRVWYKITNLDACNFLVKRRNPALRLLFSTFQKSTNINHTCPYKDYLILNELAINNPNLALIPFISGEYELQTEWRLNGKNAAQVTVFIRYNRNTSK